MKADRATRGAKVATRNPRPGTRGRRIDARKYWAVREAIARALPMRGAGLPFTGLAEAVHERLPGGTLPGGGSLGWYTTTVKLDMEARGLIERVPGATPQRLRRVATLRRCLTPER